jgi:dihydroorotate dehydrogenase (fumarate)
MELLTTQYMGLDLKSPVIAGSCGLTNNIENIKEIARHGAGAVVLKSIFEEQIVFETEKLMQSGAKEMETWQNAYDNIMLKRSYDFEEAFSYYSNHAKEQTLGEYLKFIETAKKAVDIPVIASINCISQYDWQYFAKKIQDAGADAIELNIFVLPSNFNKDGIENEKMYSDIVSEVKKYVSIPVALKIGYYFSGLAKSIKNLSESGISALVLFNRPYNPDIDIERLELSPGAIVSNPVEFAHTLRWVAILSDRISCQIAASTGVHTYESVIKNILAGATTVQVASAMYKHGFKIFTDFNEQITNWMKAHQFNSITEFRGKLSQAKIPNPAAYERVQFMKLFSKIE